MAEFAASVITLAQVTTSVVSLCNQYLQGVSHARDDILRLRDEVTQLQNIVENVQNLLKGPNGARLETSQQLLRATCDAYLQLEQLQRRLRPKTGREAFRRIGLRSMKWPFESKACKEVVKDLGRCGQRISHALQVDQTTVLLDIQDGVKQLTLPPLADELSFRRKPYRMVPLAPDPDFIPRPVMQQWIRDQYRKPGQRMALVGVGGFGKSQLAIDFTYHIYRSETDTSLFWVHGHTKDTFEESYRALADTLELPRRHEPNVNVLALVRDWLQRDDISPWLMIVDNADDISIFFPSDGTDNYNLPDPLAPYLPKSTIGKVLVTSRSTDAAEKLVGDGRAVLQIPVMGEDEALRLLRSKLAQEVDGAAATELVLALDCIPLAVSQAAAYIYRRSPRVTIESYLDEFRQSDTRRDKLLRSSKGDLGRRDEVSNSVLVTWQVTFEQIRRERPEAFNLLSLMSQFQAQNIPEYMLHGYNDECLEVEYSYDEDNNYLIQEDQTPVDFEDDVDVLRGYSLVTVDRDGSFTMHPLVQFCTRSWISEYGDPKRWSSLFTKLAADHIPFGDFETWSTCQSLLPHMEPLLNMSSQYRSDMLQQAEVLTCVGWYMYTTGNFVRAETLSEQATRKRTNILGHDHLLTLQSAHNLATVLTCLDRLGAAEKLFVRVIEGRKRKLGADHDDTLSSMNSLAINYSKQDRYEEAEKLWLEVRKAQEAKLGADHPGTLMSRVRLAGAYLRSGRHEEGVDILIEVANILIAGLRADNPETLESTNDLPVDFMELDQWAEGRKWGMKVMEMRKDKLGAGRIKALQTVKGLAEACVELVRSKEAQKIGAEASEVLEAKFGIEHPDMLDGMHTIAGVYIHLSRWDEAQKMAADALKVGKAKLGTEHPLTQRGMLILATACYGQGRREEATNLLQECFQLQCNSLGREHSTTQATLEWLEYWQAYLPPVEDGSSV